MKILVLIFLCVQLVAQSPNSNSDASKFPGVWDLVSIDVRWPDGRVEQYWGKNPVGRITYDTKGRMSALLMTADRNQSDGKKIQADIQSMAAGYYGSYTVDPSRQVVTHKVEASIRASESKTLERSYVFKDSTLELTAHMTLNEKPATVVLLWKRQP